MELLVVIAIIALLASLLTPTLGRARSKAEQMRCMSNMRQIGIAAMTYASSHEGSLPSATMIAGGVGGSYFPVEENLPFANALGYPDMVAAQDSGVLTCPTAQKIWRSLGETGFLSYAANRNLWWWDQSYHDLYALYGSYPIRYLATRDKPSAGAMVFCQSGRFGRFEASHHDWQWPTFLHGDQTIANGPNLNFLEGRCNVIFMDGHVQSMRPGLTAEESGNPAPDQVPLERNASPNRDAFNAFWSGK